MCFASSPSAPTPQVVAPPPTMSAQQQEIDTQSVDARDRERRRMLSRFGRSSTQATGAAGLGNPASVSQKTALGQ